MTNDDIRRKNTATNSLIILISREAGYFIWSIALVSVTQCISVRYT